MLENFIPPLLDAVLLDYQRTPVASAREPEVLSTITVIVNKLGDSVTPQVPKIFDAVFECTLNMINKDFEEYPEHRTNFFNMLQAVNQHCFGAFVAIPAAQFKLVLDSVIWAVKHTMRNVSETGLQVRRGTGGDRRPVQSGGGTGTAGGRDQRDAQGDQDSCGWD